MTAGDWFRALQVPVLPVSAGAAVAGTLLGAQSGGVFDPAVFVLVTVSVVLIQLAANLQKGLVESADLPAAPRRPASLFVFDAGAVTRLALSPTAAKRLTWGLFGLGSLFGLAVVAIRRDPVLLALGVAGAFAAYSYSGPPLKLSYRGIGELSTFAAFGPLMFSGAAYAQDGHFSPASLVLGAAFGFFAAAISFVRYFPAEEEDRSKGKQTPVVRLGRKKARGLLAGILLAGTVTFGAGGALLGPGFGMNHVVPMALSLVMIWGAGLIVSRAGGAGNLESGAAWVVGAHFFLSLLLSFGLLQMMFGA